MGEVLQIEELQKTVQLGQEEELRELTSEQQPYDLAGLLEQLPEDDQLKCVSLLPSEVAAASLIYLEPADQYRLLDHLPREEKAREIVNEMSSDALVDLITAIHPRQAERFLSWLPTSYQEKVRSLLAYPENTAGGLAAVDYIAARENWTVQRTLQHVRKVGSEAEIVSYIYILSSSGELAGVLSLRELILEEPDKRLGEVMNSNIISISANADQEEVAQVLSQYDLVAVPVIDSNRKMVGIVTVDDVIDVIEEEATEDFHKSAAVAPLRVGYRDASIWSLYRRRVGWLIILILVNLASSGVIAAYEETLASAIALAFFIPLLIDSGGNAGAQSATLMVRALATGDTNLNQWLQIVLREITIGLALGATMGLASSVLGVFRGGWEIGIVVGLAMVAIVLVANIIGIVLPFFLTRLRLDPAVASSPLITTIVDATGLLIYFSIARWVLGTVA